MRPGMGKVFKQILDHQARDADEPPQKRHRRRARRRRPRQRGPSPVNVAVRARGASAAPRCTHAGSIGP